MIAIIFVVLEIRLLAIASGVYFSCLAAVSTFALVCGRIFEVGSNALETVAWETPANFATSTEVLRVLEIACLFLGE